MTLDVLPQKTQDSVKASVQKYPEVWKKGICAWETFDRETGKLLPDKSESTGYVCHAPLLGMKDAVVVVNSNKPAWFKTNPDFFLWVFQESPFNAGVLNKEDKDELVQHAAVLDGSVIGAGGILWVCKAIRHFVEEFHKLEKWTKLRETGLLDGFQAFVGADILLHGGKPNYGNSHTSLFAYKDPVTLRKMYDEIKSGAKLAAGQANKGGYNYGGRFDEKTHNWGSLAGKQVEKPDGWGGFTKVDVPCDAKEYAAKLKEIFEGDPKNVK